MKGGEGGRGRRMIGVSEGREIDSESTKRDSTEGRMEWGSRGYYQQWQTDRQAVKDREECIVVQKVKDRGGGRQRGIEWGGLPIGADSSPDWVTSSKGLSGRWRLFFTPLSPQQEIYCVSNCGERLGLGHQTPSCCLNGLFIISTEMHLGWFDQVVIMCARPTLNEDALGSYYSLKEYSDVFWDTFITSVV